MSAHRYRPDLSGFTVLVIEDDADARELLRVALQSHGASVLEAEEVMTAQECVRRLKVNLIVTDLVLPGRDGAAFLKWLRQQPHDTGGNCQPLQSPPSTSDSRRPRSAAGPPTFESPSILTRS